MVGSPPQQQSRGRGAASGRATRREGSGVLVSGVLASGQSLGSAPVSQRWGRTGQPPVASLSGLAPTPCPPPPLHLGGEVGFWASLAWPGSHQEAPVNQWGQGQDSPLATASETPLLGPRALSMSPGRRLGQRRPWSLASSEGQGEGVLVPAQRAKTQPSPLVQRKITNAPRTSTWPQGYGRHSHPHPIGSRRAVPWGQAPQPMDRSTTLLPSDGEWGQTGVPSPAHPLHLPPAVAAPESSGHRNWHCLLC